MTAQKEKAKDSPPEDEAWLRSALARHGLTLRPEDAAAALATARFLAEAAQKVREAGN
ncbi:MAG: hypothetical protein ACKVPY_07475 [Paracoccaceae bacterium]